MAQGQTKHLGISPLLRVTLTPPHLAHRPNEFTGIRFCRRVTVQRVVAERVSISMVEMSDHNEQEWAWEDHIDDAGERTRRR